MLKNIVVILIKHFKINQVSGLNKGISSILEWPNVVLKVFPFLSLNNISRASLLGIINCFFSNPPYKNKFFVNYARFPMDWVTLARFPMNWVTLARFPMNWVTFARFIWMNQNTIIALLFLGKKKLDVCVVFVFCHFVDFFSVLKYFGFSSACFIII